MPGLVPTSQDYAQFIEITGSDQASAAHFLENGTTLQGAIEDFFAAREAGNLPKSTEDTETDDDDEAALEEALTMSDPTDQPQPPSGTSTPGARTLGGQAVDTSLPADWGKKEKKFGRVGDWGSGAGGGGGGGGGFGGAGDDDDDGDDDEDARRGEKELYTGGEKSGLAVENPDQKSRGARGLVSDILKQARGNTPKEPPQNSRSGFFGGSGNTLGSDETPSVPVSSGNSRSPAPTGAAAAPRVAAVSSAMFDQLLGGMFGGRGAPPPPPPPQEEEEEVQTRQLTFWRNGFSIEDGPLMEYDAPGNQDILRAIQSGRAPPSLFGVRYNQPLQVEVAQRTGEEYVRQPKRKMKGFEGEGNRLGSPAPALSGSAATGSAGGSGTQGILQGGQAGSGGESGMVSQGAGTGNAPKFQVDETKPTTNIQLRLADGSKLVAKVNLDHTVLDLHNFLIASQPPSAQGRSFVLQTTFPNKELTEMGLTIEQAGLKNAVVVQRYT